MKKIKIYLLLFFIGLLMNACTRKELISEEEVKKIVLKDANVENANFYKFDLNLEGESEYELGFIVKDIEYEYSVDAYNGKILERSREKMNKFD